MSHSVFPREKLTRPVPPFLFHQLTLEESFGHLTLSKTRQGRFMSQKAEKPTLSGTRLKTRKRDEKEKYDPTAFRDSIIAGLIDCGQDLEQVSKYLDKEGSKLNYRRYAEVLFDILFAGGILAPGGFIVEDGEEGKPVKSDTCVLCWSNQIEELRKFYDVFYKLIRRYKYLEKAFEDDLKKVLMFQKGFKEGERERLACITGIIMANGLATPRVITSLFEDHLVKEGISLEFAVHMFTTWLKERDISNVCQSLRKAQVESRLLEMFPLNKRSPENFSAFFRDRGLAPIAEMQSAQMANKAKKEAQKYLADMIKEKSPISEMVEYISDLTEKQGMSDIEVTISVWNSIMAGVEWNKKEDQVPEQAMKHLNQYTSLLAAAAKTGKAELSLIQKMQEYCYDNMNFLKTFQKIVTLLYRREILSEDVILKWYKDGHMAKGKSVFLEQMQKFIEWLQNAEEESGEEDED